MKERVFLIIALLITCCTNVVFLELLVKESQDSVNLILLLQFSFIAIEGFLYRTLFKSRQSLVPIKNYVIMVALSFGSAITNNIALNYDIPLPLHMVFKSGSLVTNMAMGFILFGKQYKKSSYVAIILISFGITICTLKTGWDKYTAANAESHDTSIINVFLGSFFLISSLLFSARLGLYQEFLFKKYEKSVRECLYYNHCLPLPFLLLMAPSIMNNIIIFNESTPETIPVLNLLPYFSEFYVPIFWQYLIVNVVTQYFCIFSVFALAARCSSLTVTLTVTLRKFISLVFSIFYFNNSFSLLHWLGASLVFLGTLIYADVFTTVKTKSNIKKD